MKFNSSAFQEYLLTLPLVCIPALNAFAQVELERFFPPAVQRGVATTIKADGKFPQWPLKIECDLAGLTITCGEKSGEFQVNSPATSMGAAWIRLHDDQAASSLVPLLIEPSSVAVETEPNENLSKATPLTLPCTIVGKLEKNGDVDMCKVRLRTGEQLVAAVTAHTLLASPMDAVLQLVDARGLVLSQAEDSNGLDPQLIFTANKEADYYLRLFCFPETPTGTIGFAGGANFNYVMRVTTSGYLDHTLPFRGGPLETLLPVAYGWNFAVGSPLQVSPATNISPSTLTIQDGQGWQWFPSQSSPNVSYALDERTTPEQVFDAPLLYFGHILKAKEVDLVRLRVKSGVNYRAAIESRDFGFKLDSMLRVMKSDLMTQIAQNDDSGRGNSDSAVEFKPTEDGEVVLEVSDLADSGSLRHAYGLQVNVAEPSVNLSVAVDHFRIGVGKSLEIPVTIDRRFGFSQRLELTVKNLPAGILLEKAYSESKGDTAKAVNLKLSAAADGTAFQGPIQLLATPVDDVGKPTGESTLVGFNLRPLVTLDTIWLSVAVDK
jgi:hypothetical protein